MEKQEMKGFYPEPDPNDVAPASGLNGEGRTEILHTPTTGFTGRIYRGSVIPNVNQIPAAFQIMDNDLAAENLEDHFDMTLADLQDL